MGDRAVDDSFVEFVLEDVLLDGDGLLEVVDGELAHVHDGADVELVDPMDDFVDAEDGAFAVFAVFVGDVLPLDLFFVVLWIFLPIVEGGLFLV